MGCYAVDLLRFAVKLDRLTTLVFASVSGFFLFMLPLHGILLVVFIKYFAVLRGVPGAMQHVRFSPVGRLLGWPA